MAGTVQVFGGIFASREEATRYAEPRWEPEPGPSASDMEYQAWEERNPAWALRDDLGVGLDEDFIETHHGTHVWSALEAAVGDAACAAARARAPSGTNTLILVYSEALYGPAKALRATGTLAWLGEFSRSTG